MNHGHDSRTTEVAEALNADLFGLRGIGYVALESGGRVVLRAAESLKTTTTPESNFYEELLVNPTLLKLAMQRGSLDCGGCRYVAIGYGGFIQLIVPMRNGHVSLGIATDRAINELAERARSVLARHDLSVGVGQETVL